jgi:tetratricopeptide (TPR) repeat protein
VAVRRSTSRLAEFDRVRGTVTARPPSVAITEESAERRSVSHHQLRRVLEGDLSAIVLKALEQDPAARYASVRAFAEDVENHLAGKPVLARPQTLLYRSRRFVRRHWLPVSAIAIGVALLSLTAGVAVIQARAARREALKAQTTSKFLQDMLATDNSVDKDITLRAMVDRAETKLNRVTIGDPLIEAELRLWLAQSYISRQEFQKGQHELDRAETLFRASGNIGDLARVDSWRALGLDSSGDRESAQRYLEETIRICRVLRNHADPDTCIQSYVNLLITHAPSLSFEQQKQLVRDAGEVVKAHPDVDPALRSKLLKGESRIAIRERRYDDAGRVLAEALVIDQRQPDPDDNAIAQDFFALADLRFRVGDIKGAADYHRQRMNLFARASGPDAAVTQHAAANLACVLSYQGNLEEARQLSDQAVAKVRDAMEYQKLAPLFSAAIVRDFSGQAAEAEPYAREAARISLKTYPKTTSVYAEHSAELGISLLLQGNVEEALPLLQAADTVFAKLNIPDYPPSGRIHRYYRQAGELKRK